MSGGFFASNRYAMDSLADELEAVLNEFKTNVESRALVTATPATLREFRIAINCLRTAHAYMRRIDYLLSGDDGEETFHKRLDKDIRELQIICPNTLADYT